MRILNITGTGEGAQREHVHISHNALVSWKPILAGLLVTAVCYIGLSALGAAIGFASAIPAIEAERHGAMLATGAAIWMGLSALASLLAGSYFAARTSTFVTLRIGAAQGLVIAALFFIGLVWGVGVTVGMAGAGLSGLASKATDSTAKILSQPAVQATVENTLSGVPLKSDPTVVAEGLATRLLSGNVVGAETYFAYQTGLPPAEAKQKIDKLSAEFKASVKEAGVKVSKAMAVAGWVFFLIVLLGVGISMLGGALGCRENFKMPLTDESEVFTRSAI